MNKVNDGSLNNLRHSCSHLLAAAVLDLWPDTKPTLGPPIADGFYYDFDFSSPLSEEDLPKIEAKMHLIAQTWNQFERLDVSKEEALNEFKENEYKR